MAPLEPWEKVLIDSKEYPETTHGKFDCESCHLGEEAEDKEAAHNGLIAKPSENSEESCGACHQEYIVPFESSLHSTQQGYWTNIETRGGHDDPAFQQMFENHYQEYIVPFENSLHSTQQGYWTNIEARGGHDDPALQQMFGNHCSGCHATCGDCHVSQPSSVGGGFIDGHNFNATPSMTRNCTACHGSRVGNEYLGKNEGLMGDVHFRIARMTCTGCHTSKEMHDTDSVRPVNDEHRYESKQTPKCENCHQFVTLKTDEIVMHNQHGNKLSCQVCHSVSYSSCDSCHVKLSEETGAPMFTTGGTYLTFLIGRNSIQNSERPYEYVPVRHIPIDSESYSFYGEDLLPNFDSLPTWAYATPHNIQRSTPQNESCNSCHGNADIFLTADKVAPEELEANKDVIVIKVPVQFGLDN